MSPLCKYAVLSFSLLMSLSSAAQTPKRLDYAREIRPFATEAKERFGLAIERVEKILADARINEQVLESIQRPAEALLWRDYRKIFITRKRIDRGLAFWKQYAVTLAAAEKKFAVAEEIIVAIIGVETFYGKHQGNIRVLDALATLAFRYPERSRFFRSELQQYLLLVSRETLDPLSLKGSYAGAMGIPQFIPSSYRRYAVDFDNDQIRDLFNSYSDAIGSVANYLGSHGWQADRAITEAVTADAGMPAEELLARGLKPHTQISELRRMGVRIRNRYADDPRASLIRLEANSGAEYWLGLNNFYVITRYNRSPLYAMAVYQLAMAIRAEYSAKRG